MFLIVVVFDCVRLLNCSITERSISFDWQNFFVSSIKFDYRTQSSDWVRLGSIAERSISYAGFSTLGKETCKLRNSSNGVPDKCAIKTKENLSDRQ